MSIFARKFARQQAFSTRVVVKAKYEDEPEGPVEVNEDVRQQNAAETEDWYDQVEVDKADPEYQERIQELIREELRQLEEDRLEYEFRKRYVVEEEMSDEGDINVYSDNRREEWGGIIRDAKGHSQNYHYDTQQERDARTAHRYKEFGDSLFLREHGYSKSERDSFFTSAIDLRNVYERTLVFLGFPAKLPIRLKHGDRVLYRGKLPQKLRTHGFKIARVGNLDFSRPIVGLWQGAQLLAGYVTTRPFPQLPLESVTASEALVFLHLGFRFQTHGQPVIRLVDIGRHDDTFSDQYGEIVYPPGFAEKALMPVGWSPSTHKAMRQNRVKTQLNGANGEATGDDDLAARNAEANTAQSHLVSVGAGSQPVVCKRVKTLLWLSVRGVPSTVRMEGCVPPPPTPDMLVATSSATTQVVATLDICDPPLWSNESTNHHVVPSSLNGANGEVTGTDDLADKLSRSQRKLDRKTRKKLDQVNNEEPAPPPIAEIVCVHESGYAWTTKGQARVLEGVPDRVVTAKGEIFPTCVPNTLVFLTATPLIGVYLTQGVQEVLTVSAFWYFNADTESCLLYTTHMEPDAIVSGIGFRIGYDLLKSKFFHSKDSVENVRLLSHTLITAYPTLDMLRVVDTVRIFRFDRFQAAYRNERHQTLTTLRDSVINTVRVPAWEEHHLNQRHLELARLNGFHNMNPNPIKLVNQFFAGELADTIDTTKIEMGRYRGFNGDTMEFATVNENPSSFFHTKYMSLCGAYDPVYLSNHPRNCASALMRFLRVPLECENPIRYSGKLVSNQAAMWEAAIEPLPGDIRHFLFGTLVELKRACRIPKALAKCPPELRSAPPPKLAEALGRMLYYLTNHGPLVLAKWAAFQADTLLDPEAFKPLYLALPHAKRLERLSFYERWLETFSDQVCEKVTLKLKDEAAKWGKYARLYVTYGPGSIYFPWVFEQIKELAHGWYLPNGEKLRFPDLPFIGYQAYQNKHCAVFKPSYKVILEIFREGWKVFNNECGVARCSATAGDDGVIFAHTGTDSIATELDIKACDSTQSSGAWLMMGYVLSFYASLPVVLNFLSAHTKPMRLMNPHNPNEFVELIPQLITLGSGSTATTVINNLGNLGCFIGYMQAPLNDVVDFHKLGTHFGYVQEGTNHSVFEKAFFIKYFPYRVNGVVWASLGLGVYIRTLGTVSGILTKEMFPELTLAQFRALPLADAVDSYMACIIAGHVHQPGNFLLTALRTRFLGKAYHRVLVEERFDVEWGEEHPPDIPLEAIQCRYDISPEEATEVVELILKWECGDHFYHAAFGKLLQVDYGYPVL